MRCSVKKLFFLATAVFLLLLPVIVQAASPINEAGYFKGIKLCGRVKVVEHNADIRVKIVESFADLRVKRVDYFADKPGEWQFVEYNPDFTVQFVDSFPDIKIKFVDSFPGVN